MPPVMDMPLLLVTHTMRALFFFRDPGDLQARYIYPPGYFLNRESAENIMILYSCISSHTAVYLSPIGLKTRRSTFPV